MKMKRVVLPILTVVWMLLLAGPAMAAEVYATNYGFYIGVGETILPNYAFPIYMVDSSLRKDDFTFSYGPESDLFWFDEDGRITISEDVVAPCTFTYEMTCTPKVEGKGREIVFTGSIWVRDPLTEITLPSKPVVVALDENYPAVEVSQPVGTGYDLRIGSYDESILSAGISQKTSDPNKWSVRIIPKAVGETVVEIVGYNGYTVYMPVKVTVPPTEVSFEDDVIECYVGDVVDLGVLYGACEGFTTKPNISLTKFDSGINYRDYIPTGWEEFHAIEPGYYEVRLTTYNYYSGTVALHVYSNENCADIQLAEGSNPRVGYRYQTIYMYDAEGNQLHLPLTITKGADIVSVNRYRLDTTDTGVVELTAHNPDGTTFSQEFTIYDMPSKIVLNSTNVVMEIGDTFDLDVGFDKGTADYKLSLSFDNYSPAYFLYPVKLEGHTITARAPGTAYISVTTTDGLLSATCRITVNDSDAALEIDVPEGYFGVGHTYQLQVRDRAGNIYPATFAWEGTYSEPPASVTPDGLMTGNWQGTNYIIATVEDGRTLRFRQDVYRIPEWIKHGALVAPVGSSTVLLDVVDSDLGTLNITDLTVSVADTSIASHNGSYFTTKKAGSTQVTIKSRYGEAETTFTLIVVDRTDVKYIGSRTVQIPFGYSMYLPSITDEEGSIIPVTWQITYEKECADNPLDSGFFLEDGLITCLWPEAYCELTGTTETGEWILISAGGYLIPDEIRFKKSEFAIHLQRSDNIELELITDQEGCEIGPVTWFISDPDVITFTEANHWNGKPTVLGANQVGTVTITAVLLNGAYAECTISVYDYQTLTLPSSLASIGAEAFMNTDFTCVTFPSTVTSIGAGAFRGCTNLIYCVIPASVTYIADDAFEGCTNLMFYCKQNSYAMEYAKSHGIPFVLN